MLSKSLKSRHSHDIHFQVHKEACYKKGSTPVKKDPRDAEMEPKSEGIYEEEVPIPSLQSPSPKSEGIYEEEAENTYNENDDFDHEAAETMEEEEEDQEHFTSELDGPVESREEKHNSSYSVNQDEFIEDATAARVI